MNYAVILILFSELLVVCHTQEAFPVVMSSVPSHFYNFGPDVGDTTAPVNDDGSTGRIQIQTVFPFYNHVHGNLFVSILL